MSILIKGMEMPKNCHECELVDILPACPCRKMADEDFWNNVSLAFEGHKDCPLAAVPPHGKWEKHDDGIMFWWECSECHQDPWYDREELYDYCPSCGAKMEFGESEEE